MDVVAPTDPTQTHAKEGTMFLTHILPISLFRPKGQVGPNLHATDGTAGRSQTPVGRSPRARLHAELLFGR